MLAKNLKEYSLWGLVFLIVVAGLYCLNQGLTNHNKKFNSEAELLNFLVTKKINPKVNVNDKDQVTLTIFSNKDTKKMYQDFQYILKNIIEKNMMFEQIAFINPYTRQRVVMKKNWLLKNQKKINNFDSFKKYCLGNQDCDVL